VLSLAFSPDTTLLAAASSDGFVRVWDTTTGQERLTLSGQRGTVFSVAFSPDGKYLATGGSGDSIQVYLTRLDDIVALARSRVTRTLTQEECVQYLRLEQCPALPTVTAPSPP
jgi:WD40 repeat protein